MSRPVAICADDFGMSAGVNRAVLDLAGRRRISAVSCMVTPSAWPAAASMLSQIRQCADIGLHLTLTDARPLTASSALAPDGRLPTIAALITRCQCRFIAREPLRREIGAQIDAFTAATGFAPDYIDGHMHAHALPVIRDIVADVVREKASKAWIRDPRESWGRLLRRRAAVTKAMIISAVCQSWPGRTNQGFSGIYDFNTRDYGALFDRFITDLGPRPLIVVHPSDDVEESTAHAAARVAEYRFLSSDAFIDAMKRARLVVARLSEMP